jgi:hypothetical protein
MYDNIQYILALSLSNSLAHNDIYSSHEFRNARPFVRSPSKSAGDPGLMRDRFGDATVVAFIMGGKEVRGAVDKGEVALLDEASFVATS